MSIIDMDVSGAVEPTVVEPGTYQLTLLNGDSKVSDKGFAYVSCMFEIVGQPTAKDVFHTFFLPQEGDSEKRVNNKKFQLKKFYDAFGIDSVGGKVDLDQAKGKQGWVNLGAKEDAMYGPSNNIRDFVIQR